MPQNILLKPLARNSSIANGNILYLDNNKPNVFAHK